MKILIIGMGMIGKTILETLIGEGHTITIIDENKQKIEKRLKRKKLIQRIRPIISVIAIIIIQFIISIFIKYKKPEGSKLEVKESLSIS